MQIIPHNTRARLVYELDLTASAGTNVLATILSATVAARGLASGAALTITAQAISGQRVRLELDGGADGEIYRVDVVVADSTGQEHAGSFEVHAFDFGWTAPDGSGGYLTPLELVDRLGYEQVVRLTDGLGLGRADRRAVLAALDDAQAIADGFVQQRYTLPLSPVPGLLKVVVADLAWSRMHTSTLPEHVAQREKQAVARLQQIARGELLLPATAPLAEASPGEVLVVAPERRFTDETLAGW